MSLIDCGQISLGRCSELSKETGIGDLDMYSIRKPKFVSKHHTIRAGHRWKPGDRFSPRVWSGKPYVSKQIIIAPDIEVKKVWNFEISENRYSLGHDKSVCNEMDFGNERICRIAMNDGLTLFDFREWFQFPKPFSGQIICWNEDIEY